MRSCISRQEAKYTIAQPTRRSTRAAGRITDELVSCRKGGNFIMTRAGRSLTCRPSNWCLLPALIPSENDANRVDGLQHAAPGCAVDGRSAACRHWDGRRGGPRLGAAQRRAPTGVVIRWTRRASSFAPLRKLIRQGLASISSPGEIPAFEPEHLHQSRPLAVDIVRRATSSPMVRPRNWANWRWEECARRVHAVEWLISRTASSPSARAR